MASTLRALAQAVRGGIDGDISLLGHVFGFHLRKVPPHVADLSVLKHFERIRGRFINVNFITLGIDRLSEEDQLHGRQQLDFTVNRLRSIFEQVPFSVGRAEFYAVPAADAHGFDEIESKSESTDMRCAWTVSNDGIDIFIPRIVTGRGDRNRRFDGHSPTGGACAANDSPTELLAWGDKDSKDGALLGCHFGERGFNYFSVCVAHEIGHYLGLSHNHGDDDCPTSRAGRLNLMAQGRCYPEEENAAAHATRLTAAQREVIRQHCMVRGVWPPF